MLSLGAWVCVLPPSGFGDSPAVTTVLKRRAPRKRGALQLSSRFGTSRLCNNLRELLAPKNSNERPKTHIWRNAAQSENCAAGSQQSNIGSITDRVTGVVVKPLLELFSKALHDLRGSLEMMFS